MAALLGLIVFIAENDTEVVYEQEMATSTPQVVEPQYPDEWTQEAQEAYEEVIKRKQLELELLTLQGQETELAERIKQLELELDLY